MNLGEECVMKIQEERYQELSLIRVLIKGKGTTNVIVNIQDRK